MAINYTCFRLGLLENSSPFSLPLFSHTILMTKTPLTGQAYANNISPTQIQYVISTHFVDCLNTSYTGASIMQARRKPNCALNGPRLLTWFIDWYCSWETCSFGTSLSHTHSCHDLAYSACHALWCFCDWLTNYYAWLVERFLFLCQYCQ